MNEHETTQRRPRPTPLRMEIISVTPGVLTPSKRKPRPLPDWLLYPDGKPDDGANIIPFEMFVPNTLLPSSGDLPPEPYRHRVSNSDTLERPLDSGPPGDGGGSGNNNGDGEDNYEDDWDEEDWPDESAVPPGFVSKEKISVVLSVLILLAIVGVVLFFATHEFGCPTGCSSSIYEYFPARADGDDSDVIFCFGAFLRNAGAHHVRYSFREGTAGPHCGLAFDLRGRNYELSTFYEEKSGLLSSQLIIFDGTTRYTAKPQVVGSSGVIMDHDRPFWVERGLFEVFRDIVANPARDNGCPLCGTKFEHYDIAPDGTGGKHSETV